MLLAVTVYSVVLMGAASLAMMFVRDRLVPHHSISFHLSGLSGDEEITVTSASLFAGESTVERVLVVPGTMDIDTLIYPGEAPTVMVGGPLAATVGCEIVLDDDSSAPRPLDTVTTVTAARLICTAPALG